MDEDQHGHRVYQPLQAFPSGLEPSNRYLVTGHRQRYEQQHCGPARPDSQGPEFRKHIVHIAHIDNVENQMQNSIAK